VHQNTWPAGGHETLQWPGREASSRPPGASGLYEAFVPPRIATVNFLPASWTAALAEEAAREAVRFDERYGGPGRPMASLLLRCEAMASSRIEHFTADARSLGVAEIGPADGSDASRVAGNVRAIEAALATDSPGPDTALAAHGALLNTPGAGIRREEQVWIGSSTVSPIGAVFVPPHHSRVPTLLADLASYTHRADVPSFVQAAIAHAQFETIHPFTDGNGRTGRALLQVFLSSRGRAAATVPVSAGLLPNVRGYIDALTAYRAGDPEQIIITICEAVFRAIDNSARLAADVTAITEGWATSVTARRDSAVWPVLDLLARRPVINSALLESDLGLDYMRQHRAMAALEDAGVVIGAGKHRRSRYWFAPDMLAALDSFMERAFRR
jgi:Fic family protein